MKSIIIFCMTLLTISVIVAQPKVDWAFIDYSKTVGYIPQPKIGVDDQGNIYWGGIVAREDTLGSTLGVGKYDPQGNELWYSAYKGGDSFHSTIIDLTIDMAVSRDGYTAICGPRTYGDGASEDFLTVQFRPDGKIAWGHRLYMDPYFLYSDTPGALTKDDQGRIYVTGCTTDPFDWVGYLTTVCYSATGDTCWIDVTKTLEPDTNMFRGIGMDITLNSRNNVLITGKGIRSLANAREQILIKGPNWVKLLGAQTGYHIGVKVKADTADNVIVLGVFAGTDTNSEYFLRGDFVLLKCSPFGELLWYKENLLGDTAYFGNHPYTRKKPIDLIVDSKNNIIVTGYVQTDTLGQDICLLKFSPEGEELWRRFYSRPGFRGGDTPARVIVDSLDNIYVVGTTFTYYYGTKADISVLKYSPDGDLIWTIHTNIDSLYPEVAYDACMDDAGNIYVVGTAHDYPWPGGSVLLLVKYSGALSDMAPRIRMEPRTFSLYQNYPNPFNPSTVIAFELARNGEITLRVFDVLGRRVRTLAKGRMTAGRHTMVWDGRDDAGRPVSSGVYVYRLQSERMLQSRKMLLLR